MDEIDNVWTKLRYLATNKTRIEEKGEIIYVT